jgi:hypothetical protein
MFVPTIPFEYARLVDMTADRVRRTTTRPTGARVRRPARRRDRR